MSTYLDMWQAINELNGSQCREWLNAFSPTSGREVNFRGVYVLDNDLVEALQYAVKNDGRKRQPTIEKDLDGTLKIYWGTANGDPTPYPILIVPTLLEEMIDVHNRNLRK